MELTEKEARRKVCPLRANATDHRCTASDCMLWRWTDRLEGGMTAWKENRLGYCGLGGRALLSARGEAD